MGTKTKGRRKRRRGRVMRIGVIDCTMVLVLVASAVLESDVCDMLLLSLLPAPA